MYYVVLSNNQSAVDGGDGSRRRLLISSLARAKLAWHFPTPEISHSLQSLDALRERGRNPQELMEF
jgi:hypothetical protein